jgi:hypothetical protein
MPSWRGEGELYYYKNEAIPTELIKILVYQETVSCLRYNLQQQTQRAEILDISENDELIFPV